MNISYHSYHDLLETDIYVIASCCHSDNLWITWLLHLPPTHYL